MKKIINYVKWAIAIVCMAAVSTPVTVFAGGGSSGGGSYVAPINALKSVMLSIITAAGVIIIIWGVVRFAIAFQKHDQNAEYAGIFTIVAGALLIGAQAVLTALGV